VPKNSSFPWDYPEKPIETDEKMWLGPGGFPHWEKYGTMGFK